jgi:uncharacterized protein (DUF362 family)
MTIDRGRRHVIESLGLLVAAAASPRVGRGAPASRPVVARARREGVVDPKTGQVDAGRLESLAGAAVTRALGARTPVEGFRRLFRPNDVVGIKVNTLAGRGLSSHPELVLRLAKWLTDAGVAAGNIVIWDRAERELSEAGFRLNRSGSGVRCLGTNEDYDWKPREWGAGGSCFARILVSELTALINVGVLKDHDLAGVSAGLKNLYGTIHNPNKYHDNGCDPYVAELATHPLIRKKLRLTVVDGLTAQCHGGPARSPRWAWPWGGVLVSTDPVAVDAVAWRILEEQRKKLGLKTLAEEKREPKWLLAANRLGLGENNWQKIDLADV